MAEDIGAGALGTVQVPRLTEQQNIGFGHVQAEPFVAQRVAPHAVVL
ncbi:hypothetical protein [Streptomyces sp. NPDC102409]